MERAFFMGETRRSQLGNSLTIQWLGDIAPTAQYLDPANHGTLQANALLVSRLSPKADLRIGNWEAPLLGDQGLNPLKKVRLYTDSRTAEKVMPLELDVAILANNHAFDCLESGFDRTIDFLTARGISTIGAARSLEHAQRPLEIETPGGRVAILAYVDDDTNPCVPPEKGMFLNRLDPDRVISDVTRLSREGKIVLVHFHCGLDFTPIPAPHHRALSREAIRSGASVVICGHPHRIQAHESVDQGHVFYGLGNLIAGSIYPWPRFSQPTVVVECAISERRVVDVTLRHFVLADGVLLPDKRGRGPRVYRRGNLAIQASETDYLGRWKKALAWDAAVTRPLHFLVRNKNPVRLLAALEKRHFVELAQSLKRAAGR